MSLPALSGCYVPLRSPGILASTLPDSFRTPQRSVAVRLNLSALTVPPPSDYILGPNDTLDVTVSGLFGGAEVRPIRTQIMADGTITMPLVGKLSVAGTNLASTQETVQAAYSDGFLVNPRVSVTLAEKQTIDVSVIGEVTSPGVFSLPRYQNNIGHALGLAGGLAERSEEVVEVHRRMKSNKYFTRLAELKSRQAETLIVTHAGTDEQAAPCNESKLRVASFSRERLDTEPFADASGLQNHTNRASDIQLVSLLRIEPIDDESHHWAGKAFGDQDGFVKVILRIPLRGGHITMSSFGNSIPLFELTAQDVTLEPGDVVVVPRKKDEVFFVTGPLSRSNVVNFSVRERDRELGNAFLIPPDRDIDVVTAVAMAGYIDPIDSPSTVTVHRSVPGRPPMLIHVDLIAARFCWRENLYVQPGDIIYLNPDPAWWFRRTFDRILPTLLTSPYTEAMGRWINPRGGN